jgi:hypothetical protein
MLDLQVPFDEQARSLWFLGPRCLWSKTKKDLGGNEDIPTIILKGKRRLTGVRPRRRTLS